MSDGRGVANNLLRTYSLRLLARLSHISVSNLLARAVRVARGAACVAAVLGFVTVVSGCRPGPRPEGDWPGPDVTHPPVPGVRGWRHVIRSGETLISIAAQYHVDWHTILDANPGLDPLDLQPGQVILIPREPALVKVSPDRQPRVVQPERPPRNPGYPGPLAAERTFAWPLRGTIIVRFGRTVSWRMGERNQGVDIRAKPGQVVSAAKSGRVSTFTDFPGYGRVIVLEHRDGTVTFYGHLDELLIDHGRWAKQGERIATAGSTGRSSGTELHFRVMRGSTLIDPVKHLPR